MQEFEVNLEKINGSLGFTLRQEDTSLLGHYVRALVKDPALSDGRIQPGDRILSVNGQDLSGVSHADAIAFLRQCPPKVTLRLYRDVAPTPISPLSPTESHKSIKTKSLRQEATDMVNDLELRKKMSGCDPKSSLPGSAVGRTGLRGKDVHDGNCHATLPTRRHGLGGAVTSSPEVLSAALDRFAGRSTPKSSKIENPESIGSSHNDPHNYSVETRSSGSGASTPAGTIIQSRIKTNRAAYSNFYNSNQQKNSVSSEHTSMELGSRSNRKPSFRQYTLHLDRISSFEDESFSSDLNHVQHVQHSNTKISSRTSTSPAGVNPAESAPVFNCNASREISSLLSIPRPSKEIPGQGRNEITSGESLQKKRATRRGGPKKKKNSNKKQGRKCAQCDSRFMSEKSLQNHQRSSCGKSKPTKKSKSKLATKNTLFTPETAGAFQFFLSYPYQISEGRFKCGSCPLSYKGEKFLQHHIRNVHISRNFRIPFPKIPRKWGRMSIP